MNYPSGTGNECALNDINSNSNATHTISTFGGIGFPNARLKPDLVAPGARSYGATSAVVGQLCTGLFGQCNNDLTGSGQFSWGAGTSFSTPVVTGAAALAKDWLTLLLTGTNPTPVLPAPALIKATLIASSKNLVTCNPGCPDCSPTQCFEPWPGGACVRPAPDRYQGWGGVSLETLFRGPSNYWFGNQTSDMALSQNSSPWYKVLYVTDMSKAVSITLAWTDPPGSILGDTGVNLVNDLDMLVYGYKAGTGLPIASWYGNYFYTSRESCDRKGYSVKGPYPAQPVYEHRNNVEKVIFDPSLLMNRLKIFIYPTTVAGTQDFAMAVVNAHE